MDTYEDEDKVYAWPVEKDALEGFSPLESPVHRDVPKLLNACDFVVPLRSNVLAMYDGEVTYVKQNSKDFEDGGNDSACVKKVEDSKFYNKGNRIEIYHGNNEYSAYEHLAFNGSFVKVGDKVKKGNKIAITGYTGLMAHLGPHLHVERFYWFEKEEDYKTLQIHWEDENILFTYCLWNRKKWMEIGNSREIKRGVT